MTRAFIDLETTGLDPQIHEPWDIAVIVEGHSNPAVDGEWCWQIRPDLTDADPKALKIGRYWERAHTLLGGSTPGAGRMLAAHGDDLHPGVAVNTGEIADWLAGLLAGAELVGVNVQFDAAFLATFLRRNNQAPSWDYHLTEICSMARGWLHGRGFGHELADDVRRAVDLSLLCGVDPPSGEDRHTALGDARWVKRWHWHLTVPTGLAARLAANETTVLEQLADATEQVGVVSEPTGQALVSRGAGGWVWRCEGWDGCDGYLATGYPSSTSAADAARTHLRGHERLADAQQEVRRG